MDIQIKYEKILVEERARMENEKKERAFELQDMWDKNRLAKILALQSRNLERRYQKIEQQCALARDLLFNIQNPKGVKIILDRVNMGSAIMEMGNLFTVIEMNHGEKVVYILGPRREEGVDFDADAFLEEYED